MKGVQANHTVKIERTNAVDALKKGMDDLTELCEYIKEAYMAELANYDTSMD